MKEYLAIFDLDGTLFDTFDVNYSAYKDALARFEIELDREYYITFCNGRHFTEFLPNIMGSSEHVEEVHHIKKDVYQNNLCKARENKHLFHMIDLMKKTYYLAIVTTASRQNTMEILKYFGYDTLFNYVVTQEDTTKLKPDPEGFLSVMSHVGVDAEHTVIFEDSDLGIEAARKTGATVMVVDRF